MKIDKPYVIVPMTVDFDRFENLDTKNKPIKYIAYCGVLNNEKDGVDILIDAFIELSKEFPDLVLYLIGGSASEKEYQSYIDTITKAQLTNKVIFTGRVSKDSIPELLCNASILVLARPESLQAEGGFPSKLGEYLATSNPVVVTKVGEIAEYFTDEVNIFLADPGSVESLQNKIKKVLLNYNYAKDIGANGKNTAMKYFNSEIQAKNIIHFIKSFKER